MHALYNVVILGEKKIIFEFVMKFHHTNEFGWLLNAIVCVCVCVPFLLAISWNFEEEDETTTKKIYRRMFDIKYNLMRNKLIIMLLRESDTFEMKTA